MTNPIYKCSICGNIVELLYSGGGQLVCCGQPMILLSANTVDASHEKHVPVIEVTDEGVTVTVGSVPHPMEPEHYIEWIEISRGEGKTMKHYLKPGDKPQISCKCKCDDTCDCGCNSTENITARCYCNIHGLWQSVK